MTKPHTGILENIYKGFVNYLAYNDFQERLIKMLSFHHDYSSFTLSLNQKYFKHA